MEATRQLADAPLEVRGQSKSRKRYTTPENGKSLQAASQHVSKMKATRFCIQDMDTSVLPSIQIFVPSPRSNEHPARGIVVVASLLLASPRKPKAPMVPALWQNQLETRRDPTTTVL
eukprot:3328650-Amphidinium_carterae.1